MNISIDNKLQMLQSSQVNQKEAIAPAAENTAADVEVQKSVSVTNKTDRIEISAEGRAALAQSAVVSANEAQSVEQAMQTAQAQQMTQAAETVQTAQAQQTAQAAEAVSAQTQQTAQAETAQQETQMQAAKLDASGQKAALGMAQEAQTEEETDATVLAEATDSETASDEAVIASAESSSTTNLTSLSEQQIKDLVSDGTISQTEANTELARRAAAQQQMQQTQGDPVEEAASVDAKAAEAVESKNDPQQQAAQMYTQMQQNEGSALFSAVA